jgi:DNA polymerase III subunit delta
MVAVKASQAQQFLKAPPKGLIAVLFFGSDPGLVSERSLQLAKLMAARETPEGEILRLDDADLDEDTGRLAVELNTRPMFSGRKIIRATAGRRITTPLLKPLLTGGGLEGFLIVEAGNLKPDDGLRALFEKEPSAAAVACYPDSDADLEGLVGEVLAPYRMKIEPDARELLVARLGADRSLSRAEIEKLALFVLGREIITLDDVEAVVGDASDLGLEKIAEAAASGEAQRAIADFGRAIASGESAQAIILITQRYFLKLHRIRADLDGGQALEDALRGIRPPLHFKSRPVFAAQCRRWSRAGLDAALKRIAETAKAARLNSQLEDTLGERLILALSAMAAPSATATRRR